MTKKGLILDSELMNSEIVFMAYNRVKNPAKEMLRELCDEVLGSGWFDCIKGYLDPTMRSLINEIEGDGREDKVIFQMDHYDIYYTMNKVSRSNKADDTPFKHWVGFSKTLCDGRHDFAHERGDGMGFEKAKELLNALGELAFRYSDELLDKVKAIGELLADPTRNEEYVDATRDSDDNIITVTKQFRDGSSSITLDMILSILAENGIDHRNDSEQLAVISHPINSNLRVIAGPGSGKTAVMTTFILKAIFLDNIPPSSIVATTFTRKAAAELKTRIIANGELLLKRILHDKDVTLEEKDRIRYLNFNEIMTGTIDSIAMDAIGHYGCNGPVIAEKFVQYDVMNDVLNTVCDRESLRSSLNWLPDNKSLLDGSLELRSRLMESMVDVEIVRGKEPQVAMMIEGFNSRMDELGLTDFPTVEYNFLNMLESTDLNPTIDGLKLLVIDEYQDTNLLQEAIYMNIGKRIVKNGGSVKVVGDDDQSLYRFRGARVDLFTELDSRAKRWNLKFDTKYLRTNYRSTSSIVEYCNKYANLDPHYSELRKEKGDMKSFRDKGVPILGLFCNDRAELSKNIANLVRSYVDGGSISYIDGGGERQVLCCSTDPKIEDIVMLMYSTDEKVVNGKEEKIPSIIPRYLNNISEIEVINPGGKDISDSDKIRTLCGLMSLCFDTSDIYMDIAHDNTREGRELALFIKRCRKTAEKMSGSVMDYVNSWKNGVPYSKDRFDNYPEISPSRVLYELMYLMGDGPGNMRANEYQHLMLDVLQESIQTGKNTTIIQLDEKGKLSKEWVTSFYRTVYYPICKGIVELESEDPLDPMSSDGFRIMTIHKAKGLEFPIVIVDVSSAFTDERYNKENRLPDTIDDTGKVDSFIRTIKTDDVAIPSVNAQIDEIIRKYFVAFSRARDVLIVVGIEKNGKKIPNMAIGYTRDGEYKGDELGITRMRSIE